MLIAHGLRRLGKSITPCSVLGCWALQEEAYKLLNGAAEALEKEAQHAASSKVALLSVVPASSMHICGAATFHNIA